MENPDRREFIRNVGIMLAALIATGCELSRRATPTPMITCYEMVEPSPTPGPTCYTATPPTRTSDQHWNALRECWLDLKDPQLQSYEDNDFAKNLRQRHAEALDALVANGEFNSAVAGEITVAFEQAIAHIQRQMATCYIALPPEYFPREDLILQAAALNEMADKSEIDPDTVAQVQTALERDLEWLSQFSAGQAPGQLETIEATPEAMQAARILIDLLLKK